MGVGGDREIDRRMNGPTDRQTYRETERNGKRRAFRYPVKIKSLKTLVWHLSREPMKEMSSLTKKKMIYDELVLTNKAKANNLRDEMMWA